MRLIRVLRAVAVAALPFALLGGAPPSIQAPDNAVIIYNPGNGDFTGFRIVVDRNGNAWASDGAGNEAGHLALPLTQALFADLAAVPLAEQPVYACPSSQPGIGGTSVWLNKALNRNANLRRSSGAECGGDQRTDRIFLDVVQIQHALFVSAYRSRSNNGYAPALGATTPVYGEVSSYVGPSNYVPDNSASSAAPYATRSVVNYGSGSLDAGSYSFGRTALGGGRIAGGELHFESFGNSSGLLHSDLNGNRFINSGFSGGERFSNGGFSNGGFNNGGRFDNGGHLSPNMSLSNEGKFNSGNRSGGLNNTLGGTVCCSSSGFGSQY